MAMPVLVVEDDKLTEIMLTSALISWGYTPIVATSAEQAEEKLASNGAIRLMILDWKLPGMSGIRFCRSIRETLGADYIYILLLTSCDSMEEQLQAFEAGVDDFVVKPFHPGLLRLRLRAGARMIRQFDQVERTMRSLSMKASRDVLTGIGNRESILNILSRELGRHKRNNRPLSVISLDLDNFKSINDAMGHPVGDFVLREFGNRLSSSLRSCDVCGRIGGDEFLIVLPETAADQAVQAATRLYHLLCSNSLQMDDRCMTISCSFGVTTVEAGLYESTNPILVAVDEAMYAAKRAGGSRIQFQSMSNMGDVLNISPAPILCGRAEDSLV